MPLLGSLLKRMETSHIAVTMVDAVPSIISNDYIWKLNIEQCDDCMVGTIGAFRGKLHYQLIHVTKYDPFQSSTKKREEEGKKITDHDLALHEQHLEEVKILPNSIYCCL